MLVIQVADILNNFSIGKAKQKMIRCRLTTLYACHTGGWYESLTQYLLIQVLKIDMYLIAAI